MGLFSFSEDFAAVVISAGDVFEACFCERDGFADVVGDADGKAIVVIFE